MGHDFPPLVSTDVRITAGAEKMTSHVGIYCSGGDTVEICFADADLCPDIECGMVPPGVLLGIAAKLTGLCFVEEASSGKVYPFTFDKIRGYRGETVRELGLRSGLRIRFTIGETSLIDSVELPV